MFNVDYKLHNIPTRKRSKMRNLESQQDVVKTHQKVAI